MTASMLFDSHCVDSVQGNFKRGAMSIGPQHAVLNNVCFILCFLLMNNGTLKLRVQPIFTLTHACTMWNLSSFFPSFLPSFLPSYVVPHILSLSLPNAEMGHLSLTGTKTRTGTLVFSKVFWPEHVGVSSVRVGVRTG